MFPFREDRVTLLLLVAAGIGYLFTHWIWLGVLAAWLGGYYYGRRSAFVHVDKSNFEKAYPGEKWED